MAPAPSDALSRSLREGTLGPRTTPGYISGGWLMHWQDYKDMTDIGPRIGRKVEVVKAEPSTFDQLSVNDKIAVALVLNKPEMFPANSSTILDVSTAWTPKSYRRHSCSRRQWPTNER
jgi:hypothetical protein